MLLAPASNTNNYSSGVIRQKEFSVAANGKAFKVLTDTLYQNKIGSIVREISTNAVDSHTEADCAQVPFEIHMPNVFEPWFSVKDFGVGLSQSSVEDVFTNLFESTKDASNDQVGAFGIGGKSPFSYTDTFTIVSNYGGLRSSYGASKQDDGLPLISLLAESDTSEPNGVEVLIPVEPEDFYTFRKEVSEQLAFFPVKPIIVNGAEDFAFRAIPTDVTMLDCKMHIYNNAGRRPATYIVQGGIGYPLDYNLLVGSTAVREISSLINFIRLIENAGAILYFNIGDIDVTPSRENISYSPRTFKNIVAMFDAATFEIGKAVNDDISKLTNNWKRCIFVNQTNDLIRATVFKNNVYNLPYTNSKSMYSAVKPCYRNTKIIKDDGTEEIVQVSHFRIVRFMITTKYGVSSVSRSIQDSIVPTDNTRIFIHDECSGGLARIRNLVRETDDTIFVIEGLNTKFVNENQIATFSAAFGDVEIGKVSELHKPVRQYNLVAGSRTGRGKISKLWTIDDGFSSMIKAWTPIYESIKEMVDGGYYLVVSDNRTVHLPHHLHDTFDYCTVAGLLDKEVFAIREKDVALIIDNPRWVPLAVAIAGKKVELVQNNQKTLLRIARMRGLQSACNSTNISSEINDILVENIEKIINTDLKKFIKLYHSSNNCKTDALWDLLCNYGTPDESNLIDKFSSHFVKIIQDIKDRYVLLQNLSIAYRQPKSVKMAEHLINYVNSVA